MSLLKLESHTSPAAPSNHRAAAGTSPGAYVGAGAAGGVIATLLVVALVLGVSKGGWSWPVGVKAGPRNVVVLRESKQDNVARGILWTTLQSGEAAAYRAEKGHKLVILDVDAKDPTNEQVEQVKAWRAALGSVQLPAWIVTDPASQTILDKRTIPDGTTAAQCTDWLKAKDG